MFGLSVLESALALILNNRLPLKLVNEIFTVRFLDKLDAEVAACYSKVCTMYSRFKFEVTYSISFHLVAFLL